MNTQQSAQNVKSMKKMIFQNLMVIFGAIFIVLVVLIVGIISINNANKTVEEENGYLDQFNEMVIAHYSWSVQLNNAINYGVEFTGSLDPTTCGLGTFMYSPEVQNNPQFTSFIRDVEGTHNTIHSSAEEIMGYVAQGDELAAAAIYTNTTLPAIETLVATIESYAADMELVIADAQASFNTTTSLMVGASVLAVALVIIACIRFNGMLNREMITKIHDMLLQVQRLAKGELSLDLDIACNSQELIEFRDALKFSTEELSRYVHVISDLMAEYAEGNFTVTSDVQFLGDFERIQQSITTFAENMVSTVKNIQRVAEQVSGASSQIAESSNELATGATEQAGVTQELSATITNATEELNNSADIAQECSLTIRNTGEEIVKGNQKVLDMVQSMNEISESSEKISKIISTINDIASQTNLLALNASIEAARAGEAGRGFAVVADQVSVLAAESAEAAKESNVLIQASLEAVNKGTVVAGDTAKQLERVVQDSEQVTKVIGDMADNLRVQLEGFQQIISGVDQINDVVQTNSALSEESAAASQEMNTQAESLKEMMDQFKV
ncbi:MAG: methyl-accepting chemotaxis protein [Lachnospiraceae bacterium]|nr:methyl-accepting chemotaxis protein [Lachnospiraceae bacterium]